MKAKNPRIFRVLGTPPAGLEMETKCSCNPEFTGIRIVEVVAPPIEIQAEDLKDIAYAQ